MSHRPSKLLWTLGVALLTLATGPGPVPADILMETSTLPTSSVVTLSGSEIVPTSYALPTTYSSTYFPTSTVVSSGDVVYPTSATYLPYTYRRARYRPRRYVERSYLATPSYAMTSMSYLAPASYVLPRTYVSTSYVPTTYVSRTYVEPTSYVVETSLATTSSTICCETAPSVAPSPTAITQSPPSTNPGTTIRSAPTNPGGGGSGERPPTATVTGQPPVDEGTSSKVEPPVPKSAAGSLPLTSSPAPPRAGGTETPPKPIMPEVNPNDIQLPPAGQGGPGGRPASTPKLEEMQFRDSQRPVYGAGTGASVRNILRGRVVSYESGQPEEGVTVIVSNRQGPYIDRPAMTDAYGDFKVSLPDGDWTVKVKMPSGSVFAVGRDYVTAGGGRVTDTSGVAVREFLIKR